jgi:predicted TIM-barrel enzyme
MVVERSGIPVGVDASFNDGVAGIAISCVSNARFIRSPVFVDSVQVDEDLCKDLMNEVRRIQKEPGNAVT